MSSRFLGAVILLLGAAMAAEVLKPHPKALPNKHAPEMVKFIVADPVRLPGIVVDETSAELVGEWEYCTI